MSQENTVASVKTAGENQATSPPSSSLSANSDALLEGAEERPVSYLFILIASGLMLLAVWAFMQVLHQATEQTPHPNTLKPTHESAEDMPRPGSTLVSMPIAPASVQTGVPVIHDTRTLRRYYKGRAYLGAPPFVPHPVTEQNGQVDQCLACHGQGGYVPKYQAYAPITPHPTYTNCVQCHVPVRTQSLFKPTTWTQIGPPQLRRTPLPGGPPPIPHGLQLRTDCNSCHAGPGSVREIRTPHPERTNCLQCHVPRQRVTPFVSRYQPLLTASPGAFGPPNTPPPATRPK